jgi:hypothetical protein
MDLAIFALVGSSPAETKARENRMTARNAEAYGTTGNEKSRFAPLS